MAKKNVRNMKVCGQSGYKYETVPAITLKGKWLEELGFHLGLAVRGGRTNFAAILPFHDGPLRADQRLGGYSQWLRRHRRRWDATGYLAHKRRALQPRYHDGFLLDSQRFVFAGQLDPIGLHIRFHPVGEDTVQQLAYLFQREQRLLDPCEGLQGIRPGVDLADIDQQWRHLRRPVRAEHDLLLVPKGEDVHVGPQCNILIHFTTVP